MITTAELLEVLDSKIEISQLWEARYGRGDTSMMRYKKGMIDAYKEIIAVILDDDK